RARSLPTLPSGLAARERGGDRERHRARHPGLGRHHRLPRAGHRRARGRPPPRDRRRGADRTRMIAVTGTTGLTGSFVVAELERRGIAARALSRANADLRDPARLREAVRGATGIVHTACTYEDSAVDVAAMRALLDGWEGGPFIFLSTLDVYGFAAGLVTEDAPLDEGYTDYARGKILCERLLAEAAAGRGHAMLRAPYIWGP